MENNINLRQKLLLIQKCFKTFAITEESEKKANGSKKSAYCYTPGWKIVESIRDKMDELGIMLESTTLEDSHQMIDYPVYKEIAGQIVPFTKKEMYVTIKKGFTWVDAESGETVGPFVEVASGANGADKSLASALSFCERYFILKYFHITTRELVDELDAHDSSVIPGDIATKYADAKDYAGGNAGQPMGGYYVQSVPLPQPQQMTAPQVQQQPIQVQMPMPGYAAQPSVPQQQPQQMSKEQVYEMAINRLAQFDSTTPSHQNLLVGLMTQLNEAGFNTADPSFRVNLVKSANERRRGVR